MAKPPAKKAKPLSKSSELSATKSRMTPYSFRKGFVQNKTKIRVLAQNDQIADMGSPMTKVMTWDAGKWSAWTIDWTATRPWVTSSAQLFFLGPQGLVFQSSKATGGGMSTETIDPTGQGAERSGDFLDLRWIGEHLYACGMSRQVYRRDGEDRWTRVDQGTVQPSGSLEIAGFAGIDGADESDLFAVGFGGEIWRCTRGAWTQLESPTNVVLQCVRVIAPDRVYACGQNGVILRGNGNSWKALDTDAVEKEELWSIQLFNGEVYFASGSTLYKLDKNDVPQRLATKLAKDCTYRYLHANDGVMASFGSKSIAWTGDGRTWEDITP
jgi:hypothetical protein